jgi:hypothetical protein
MRIGRHFETTAEASDTYRRFRNFVRVEENRCAFFERHFLERRGWYAAVVTEELTPEDAERVAAACGRFGYGLATVLDIDHFDPDSIYRIKLGAEALASLEETFLTPSYLLVEENERFMIVSDGDYYWSIAGKIDFLKACVGGSLSAINEEFARTAKKYEESGASVGTWLSRVAREAVSPADTALS